MIAALIARYGYFALFAGTLLEGETVLLAAGFAAHQGWLAPGWVVAVAAGGGFAGDSAGFLLGRWRGAALLARAPKIAAQAPRVAALLERHPALLVIGIRFMYGLRVAGPIIMGSSGMAPRRFLPYNLLGALLWAGLFTTLGYVFGASLGRALPHLQLAEEAGLLLVLLTGSGLWLWRRRRHFKSRQPAPALPGRR